MYDDSVRSDIPSVSYVGHDYDPLYGSTTAGFVSQVRLGSKWDPQPFTVDSMKLYLQILTVKNGGTGGVNSFKYFGDFKPVLC